MPTDAYRSSLTDAVARLLAIREQLFDTTFQVAVTNELKEWSDSIPVGEVYTIPSELLSSCSDTNVQLLAQLMANVERTCDSLLNLNNLELPTGEADEA
jgi:hypothetical protein